MICPRMHPHRCLVAGQVGGRQLPELRRVVLRDHRPMHLRGSGSTSVHNRIAVVVEDRVAVVVEHGFLDQLDAGGPTPRPANVLGGDHHVGQRSCSARRPTASGRRSPSSPYVSRGSGRSCAGLHDRDHAERVGDLVDDVEPGRASRRSGRPATGRSDPAGTCTASVVGLCVSHRLTAARICRVPGSSQHRNLFRRLHGRPSGGRTDQPTRSRSESPSSSASRCATPDGLIEVVADPIGPQVGVAENPVIRSRSASAVTASRRMLDAITPNRLPSAVFASGRQERQRLRARCSTDRARRIAPSARRAAASSCVSRSCHAAKLLARLSISSWWNAMPPGRRPRSRPRRRRSCGAIPRLSLLTRDHPSASASPHSARCARPDADHRHG